jgi:hypothetical protein
MVLVFFELAKYGIGLPHWAGFTLVGLFLLILILSFIHVYVKSGLWGLTHKKTEKLDEREIQVVTHAIRISYSIFVIIVILLVYLFAILGMGTIDVVIAAALLYLAHIIPTSILAWNEKEVY